MIIEEVASVGNVFWVLRIGMKYKTKYKSQLKNFLHS